MLHFIRTNGWIVLVTVAAVTAAFLLLDPAPPREFTLATGRPDGAYHKFGLQLAEELAAQGLTMHVRSTQGSVENLRLLGDRESGVSIALVQSGISGEETELRALASLFHEPLWVFTKAGFPLGTLQDLRGRRVAVGTEGSGTLPVALRVLELNGLLTSPGPQVQVERIGGEEAAGALREGRVDAALFVGSPQGELIRGLLADSSLTFHGLRRELAYRAAMPNLTTLTIGEGQLDLAANRPPEDRVVLSSVVMLVVNEAFHPGLTPAILEAATRLLENGGALEQPGEFPAPRPSDFPLLAEATHFHRNGPPILMRYLPFWAATIAFRVVIFVVPLLALLIPLIRMAPPIYAWRTRSRIYRWYSHLREVDQRLASGAINETVDRDIAALHNLQDEILGVKVPLSYADELYDLHLHIEWVIQRLERVKKGNVAATHS
jgi:uncharacterized protein